MQERIPRVAEDIAIAEAAQLLRKGRLVAFPTERVGCGEARTASLESFA